MWNADLQRNYLAGRCPPEIIASPNWAGRGAIDEKSAAANFNMAGGFDFATGRFVSDAQSTPKSGTLVFNPITGTFE